jgi:hypothetical protein
MRRCPSIAAVLLLLTMLSIGFSKTPVFAWSQSFHAYVAKECLRLNNNYIASYNARMGAVVPDFFWYLTDTGWINTDNAYALHGPTEEGCQEETTYFYGVCSSLVNWWNYRLIYFTKGIKTHVLADILAHDLRDNDNDVYPVGYIEWWVSILADKLKEFGDAMSNDRDTLHLALEFAVDSLLIKQQGLQLSDLLFSYTQADFLEKAVKQALGNDFPAGLDVSGEFKKYLALVRILITFPAPPLKFRTSGFPQYGFKLEFRLRPSLKSSSRGLSARPTCTTNITTYTQLKLRNLCSCGPKACLAEPVIHSNPVQRPLALQALCCRSGSSLTMASSESVCPSRRLIFFVHRVFALRPRMGWNRQIPQFAPRICDSVPSSVPRRPCRVHPVVSSSYSNSLRHLCTGSATAGSTHAGSHVARVTRLQSSLYATARSLASPSPARTFTTELSPDGSPLSDVDYNYTANNQLPQPDFHRQDTRPYGLRRHNFSWLSGVPYK